jgi:hypothetical protein
MSTHALPATIDLPILRARLLRDLRAPSGVVFANGPEQPPTALEFTPDLTIGETTTLAQIIGASAKSFDLTPGEYQAIKDEAAALAAYLGAASPTAAQTVTALKALIRVVRAIVRE